MINLANPYFWLALLLLIQIIPRSNVLCHHIYLPTLVYQIDVQYGINVQVGKVLKYIKRAGQNRRTGGKLSGKSINVQGEKFLENRVKL